MKRRKEGITRRAFFFVILSVLSLVLLSCQSTGRKPRTRGDNGSLQEHAWELLTNMDSEESGYGMYTYVLFGHRPDLPGTIQTETIERYKKLLEAIAKTTLWAKDLEEFTKEETHLFYIPAIAKGKEITLPNYNSTLSLRYIATLRRMIKKDNPDLANRLTARPGPFLISALKPIGKIDTVQTDLLYADLSKTNPAAMGEVVAAYKHRISSKSVSQIERFNPFRLSLLNLILNADDNVVLVKAALADWTP